MGLEPRGQGAHRAVVAVGRLEGGEMMGEGDDGGDGVDGGRGGGREMMMGGGENKVDGVEGGGRWVIGGFKMVKI